MNARDRVAQIKETLTKFCYEDAGDSTSRVALYFASHPDVKRDYIQARGEMAVGALALEINLTLRGAALNEDAGDSKVEQLTLPGIPSARLSPLVEVEPGDWRKANDVSMNQQIGHSDRMEEMHRRKAQYQKRKGTDQRVAASVMESVVPGSADLPRGVVMEHWRDAGLFDEKPAETYQAAT